MAEIIKNVIGYKGKIIWDTSKPNGTPRKKLDVSLIRSIGWSSKIDIISGINQMLEWYINSLRNKKLFL